LENTKDIFVYVVGPTENQQTTVPSPWESYNGIAVDSQFLWVYGSEGFLCATHASVMSCVAQKRPMPRWFGLPERNLSPVLDLSSCEDDTLLVSTPDRLATGAYHVDLGPTSYEGEHAMVGVKVEPWEDLVGGATAAQVQKLPMYGWQLLERSIAAVTP
jgi:hypothetical protein